MKLVEFDLSLAKQTPLSDQVQTLVEQEREFSSLQRSIDQSVPNFNQNLQKIRQFVSREENKTVKLVDDLSRFETQCSNKVSQIVEQMNLRRPKFDSAMGNLDKFNKEMAKYDEQMRQIDASLIELESCALRNAENVPVLESTESELKTLEEVLLTRLLDLKYIKTSQQIYSNICDLFSKDLQTFAARIREPSLKRLSVDFLSDLSFMRSQVQQAEQHFNELMTKKDQLKAMLREMARKQRELDTAASSLETWLDEIEAKIERSASFSSLHKPKSVDAVRELEELSDMFKLLRAEVQQQRRSVEDFMDLGAAASTYSQRAFAVQSRYQNVEKLVTERLDSFIEQLTSARNLKENFELTNSWLNEIDQAYLSNKTDKGSNSFKPYSFKYP